MARTPPSEAKDVGEPLTAVPLDDADIVVVERTSDPSEDTESKMMLMAVSDPPLSIANML